MPQLDAISQLINGLILPGAMKIRTVLNVGGLSLRFCRSIAEQNVNSALRLADRCVPLKVHGKKFTLVGPTYSRAWAIYSDSPSRRVLNNHKRIAAILDLLSLHGCLSVGFFGDSVLETARLNPHLYD